MGRVPRDVRAPPHVVQSGEKEAEAAPDARPSGHSAGHRQGGRHRPWDRGRSRGGAEPDDRVRDRRDPGRVRGGDQAAPPEPRVHFEAYPRNRAARARHRGAGGNFEKQGPRTVDHHFGAERGREKYGKPRRTMLVYADEIEEYSPRRMSPITRSACSSRRMAISRRSRPSPCA